VQIAARDPVTLVFHNLSLYGQDSWHITQRLNLTFGLRGEFNPPPRGANAKELYTVMNLADPAALALALRGTPLWQKTYANFAPWPCSPLGVCAWQGIDAARRLRLFL
jgi:hypothetical protein